MRPRSIFFSAGAAILTLTLALLPTQSPALEPGGQWIQVPSPPIQDSLRRIWGLGDALVAHDFDFEHASDGYGLFWVYDGEAWAQLGPASTQAGKRIPPEYAVHDVARYGALFAVAREAWWPADPPDGWYVADIEFGEVGSWASLASYPSAEGRLMTKLRGGQDVLYATGRGELNTWRLDGTGWHPLGSGFGTTVSHVTTYHDQLVVLASVPVGKSYESRVGLWNGADWETLGGTLPDGSGRLFVLQDALHSGVNRWDGAQWSPAIPWDGHVRDLVLDDVLVLVGQGGLHAWDGNNLTFLIQYAPPAYVAGGSPDYAVYAETIYAAGKYGRVYRYESPVKASPAQSFSSFKALFNGDPEN